MFNGRRLSEAVYDFDKPDGSTTSKRTLKDSLNLILAKGGTQDLDLCALTPGTLNTAILLENKQKKKG